MVRNALLGFAFLAAPAVAQAPYYLAQPETPPAQSRLVVRDSVWRCGEAGCTSGQTSTRHAIVCSALARHVGGLRSFAVEGRPFSAEEMENCNRRAR